VRAIGAMAVASAIWYGIISYVAFHAGSDWDEISTLVKRSGTMIAVVAGVLLLIGVVVWLVRRRKASAT
jgi:LPXTG-motif cell wall-anchored protein